MGVKRITGDDKEKKAKSPRKQHAENSTDSKMLHTNHSNAICRRRLISNDDFGGSAYPDIPSP